jgi:predicted SAM-dependent methyltransferase
MLASLLKNLRRGHRHKRETALGVAGTELIRLHVGGQIAHPDWKIYDVRAGPHVDYVGHCTDLSRFADSSIHEIYASHVMEHLGFRDELPAALKEFHRVLAHGGLLRISVPDLNTLCALMLDPELNSRQRFEVMQMMFGGQSNAADFHHVGLNEEFLTAYLETACFIEIARVEKFGLFDDTSNMVYKKPISLNMTARKPRNAI